MKLLLRRDQKKGMLGGKITFTLDTNIYAAPGGPPSRPEKTGTRITHSQNA